MPSQSVAITRVVEAAARQGVKLQVVTFEQSTHTAQEAAAAVGAQLGQIVKSLVFVIEESDRPEACLALVSGTSTVDVPRLAAVLGVDRLRRATPEEARQLTGFSIGGIPPFGHENQLRAVLDPGLTQYETVWAAAGTANAVFQIEPASLGRLAKAELAAIGAEQQGSEKTTGRSTEQSASSPASG